MGRVMLSVLATLAIAGFSALPALAHPICFFDERNPILDYVSPVGFCDTSYDDGFCCSPQEETDAEARIGPVSGDCYDYHKQVVCGVCHPYSGHLYADLGGVDGLTMTNDFCNSYVDKCKDQIDFAADYCDIHTLGTSDTDPYWSYPLEIEEDFDNIGYQKAFPSLDKDDLPKYPMDLEMTPDGKYWWIAGIGGKIVQVESDDPSSIDDTILDMTPNTSSSKSGFTVSGEEGLLGFAIGPGFTGPGSPFFVSYTYYDASLGGERTARQSDRLSKFTYMGKGKEDETLASEEVLITSSAKASVIHAGGWVGFKPSAKNEDNTEDHLYWATGDGGPQNDLLNNAASLDVHHGKVIRISVPREGKGFTIPGDNMKGGLPEICSSGHRNLFRCGFDRLNDNLYCGEVGHTRVEEINLIECGKDYGWNRMEGDLCHRENEFENVNLGDCSGLDRSQYQSPYFQYCHPNYYSTSDETKYTGDIDICGDRAVTGLAVIGGLVYRGSKYADLLDGKYVFSDFQHRSLNYLSDEGGSLSAGVMLDGDAPRVVAFAENLEGEVFVVAYDDNIYEMPCGNLCSASCLVEGVPPTYESQGCFVDLASDRVLQIQAPTCDDQNAMSPDICAAYCSTVEGATHFGVEFASQCFCGSVDTSTLIERRDAKCTTICQGTPGKTCGGYAAIEVFEMSELTQTAAPVSPAPVPEGSSYLGCYEDDPKARVFAMGEKADDMSVERCFEYCATTTNNVYYALQYGTECWCGGVYDVPDINGVSASCTMSCGSGGGYCGGSYGMDTYAYDDVPEPDVPTPATVEGAEYLGCFGDTNAHVMELGDVSDSMTPEGCATTCTGYKFFALEYGTECYCGNDTVDPEVNGQAVCGMPSAGDAEAAGGGRFAMTTYEFTDYSPTTYTVAPSPSPSAAPTAKPANAPIAPSPSPSAAPTAKPANAPVAPSPSPSAAPTMEPVNAPSAPEPEPTEGVFLGCWHDEKKDRMFRLARSKPDLELSPESCKQVCAAVEGAAYYGVQWGVECWCGEAEANFKRHGDGICDYDCGGSNDSCGGYDAMDIYLLQPPPPFEELGCYTDIPHARILHGTRTQSETNSIEECHDICSESEAYYFGLENGSQCWCGKETSPYARHGSGDCNIDCPGMTAQTCGGTDAMSVYFV